MLRTLGYLVVGWLVHLLIYGAPIWSSVWTYVVIVFWPAVLAIWAVGWLIALLVAVVAAGLIWVVVEKARSSIRRALGTKRVNLRRPMRVW